MHVTLMYVSEKRERLVITEEYLNKSAACCPQCYKAIQVESNNKENKLVYVLWPNYVPFILQRITKRNIDHPDM
jgi:hypothetical protein